MPEKRFRVWLNEDEIFQLPDASNKIFKQNILQQVLVINLQLLINFVLLSFQDTIVYLQIPNIKKMITNQKNLTMNQYQVCLT